MEQSRGVGGQWLYDPATDAGDPLGTAGAHSSIYASLRLNTPREAIGFSDFPFYPRNDGDARRYPRHGDFLRDFCDAFGLMDAVRLNTTVLHAGPAPRDDAGGGGILRWVVRCAKQGDGGEVVTTEEVFDAAVVAVGQYTQPRLPTIKGMDKWSRRQLHSHSYRVPDPFHGEVVVVVGCHESGKDIALDLGEVAREVHISIKPMAGSITAGMSKHPNLHLHPEVGNCIWILHTQIQLLIPVPGHGRTCHRRGQPRRPAVRAHLPAGASAVALVRGRAQEGGPAAFLRDAGEVGGAGALRPEGAAAGGGDAALRRGVHPRQGGGRRAQAPHARGRLRLGAVRRVRAEALRVPPVGGLEEGALLVRLQIIARRCGELP